MPYIIQELPALPTSTFIMIVVGDINEIIAHKSRNGIYAFLIIKASGSQYKQSVTALSSI
jgi:hypothetical protein